MSAAGLFEAAQAFPPTHITGSADFSKNGTHRLWLSREWDIEKPTLSFLLCNPSKAGAEENDPTVRKCIGFAWRLGFGSIVIVNAFSFIATYPRDLKSAGYPNHPDNNRRIIQAAYFGTEGTILVCAWGTPLRGHPRAAALLKMLREHGHEPHALKLTHDGIPHHPLMLPYELKPFPIPR